MEKRLAGESACPTTIRANVGRFRLLLRAFGPQNFIKNRCQGGARFSLPTGRKAGVFRPCQHCDLAPGACRSGVENRNAQPAGEALDGRGAADSGAGRQPRTAGESQVNTVWLTVGWDAVT